MKPKMPVCTHQTDLFSIRLSDFLNQRHELVQLSKIIDWDILDTEFGQFFEPINGAPALPTRLVAGLHYLKHAFTLSDESVVQGWVENTYWQLFCGAEHFQHQRPCHPTSLTKWRQRIGEKGCEWMLSMTIQAGIDTTTVKPSEMTSVTVDSTVQEKAITYPTDGKLYERCRQHLVRQATLHSIDLR